MLWAPSRTFQQRLLCFAWHTWCCAGLIVEVSGYLNASSNTIAVVSLTVIQGVSARGPYFLHQSAGQKLCGPCVMRL